MAENKILLDETRLLQIVYGAAFLGSGGGGKIESGLKFVDKVLRSRKVFLLTFPLANKYLKLRSCIVCDIGSINQFDPDQDLALEYAFKDLEKYFDFADRIKALFPIETGPENTLAPIALASTLGLYVIDGDGAGRAVPTLPLSSFSALGKLNNSTPVAIANGAGDVMLVSSKKHEQFDSLLRPIAGLNQFHNSASLALWPDKVRALEKKCIPGTISNAMFCGQLLAGIRNKNPSDIAISKKRVNNLKGILLAKGRVDEIISQEESGFSFATIKIKNQFEKGETITILSQNENLIAYSNLSDGPIATAPDSICYLNSEFWPLTNSEIKKGDKVYLIAIMAHKTLKVDPMIKGFKNLINNLGYAGQLDFKYRGIKNLGTLILDLQKQQIV